MLLSTSQMSHVHSLHKNQPAITISDSTLEYVNVSKLLGGHLHQHLDWDEHVQGTHVQYTLFVNLVDEFQMFKANDKNCTKF